VFINLNATHGNFPSQLRLRHGDGAPRPRLGRVSVPLTPTRSLFINFLNSFFSSSLFTQRKFVLEKRKQKELQPRDRSRWSRAACDVMEREFEP
jgi:hypothetical protein